MDATGNIRLSGLINLARSAENIITFNCIYEINMTIPNTDTEYVYEFRESGAVSPKLHVLSALVVILLLVFSCF